MHLPMFNCNCFRRARGPSEEPSPPAPDQTSPEAAWESSLPFPGMSGGLTTCIHLLRFMLAASLHTSSYFSEIQWFHSACFRRILIVPRLIEWLDICVNNEWFTCGFTGWQMGVRSVQWWMEHACLRVCKLRPCTFLPKGWENNQTTTSYCHNKEAEVQIQNSKGWHALIVRLFFWMFLMILDAF